jgi:hypothetical protein
MSDPLEQRLAALAGALDLPPAPHDLIPATLGRLPDRGAGRPRRLRHIRHVRHVRHVRRRVAVTLAATLALAGAAFAITPTRHAILSVLGLRGVRIERVPSLPRGLSGAGARSNLGRRIPIERARHAAGFDAVLPSATSAAYLDRDVPGGRITLIAGRLLITEFRGQSIPVVFKLIGPGTRARQLHLRGGPAVYLSGAPHELLIMQSGGAMRSERVRRAGNVLIWQRGPVTLLIEGTHTLPQALAVAHSLR